MSHTVFPIMPINIPTSKPLLPAVVTPRAVPRNLRKTNVIKAFTSPVIDGDAIAGFERCFQASPSVDSPSSSSSSSPIMYAPVMKEGKYGALGAVTLEKSKLDLTQRQTKSSPEGLVSSAQMVKFLAINARPTTARFISRSLPQGLSRAFIGRMIADPAFLYKLLLEQASTLVAQFGGRSKP